MRKRKCLLIVMSILLYAPTLTTLAEPHQELIENEITVDAITFRGYDWGTTLEEIQEKEILPDMKPIVDYDTSDDGKVFAVATTVSTLDLYATFEFDDDGGLVDGTYAQKQAHDTHIDNLNDFAVLNGLLISKYGDATLGCYVGLRDDLDKLQISEVVEDILNNSARVLWHS